MYYIKDKELDAWWNSRLPDSPHRGLVLAREYLNRQDFYNITDDDVIEIKRKEESVERKKLYSKAKAFVDDRIPYNSNEEEYRKYLINLFLDFAEKLN